MTLLYEPGNEIRAADMEELLNKYLSNELSPEEWKRLLAWLDESPANRNEFNKFLSYNTRAFEHANDIEEVVLSKLTVRLEREKRSVTRRSGPLFLSYYWRVAAVILVISTFSIVLYETMKEIPAETPIAVMVEKAAFAGRKITTRLPDGTLVWLNSDSKLHFLNIFPDSSRDVYLKGEAYFEVAKNPDKPFRVHTSNMTVTALGTAFNVSAFEGEEIEKVTLVEGKIGVSGFNDFYEELIPGSAVEMNENTREIRTVKAEPLEIIAWKDGVLLFQDEKYPDVIKKLERWYGVSIEVDGEFPPHDQFFGRFENTTLENVLRSISSGKEFNFEIKDKQVIITFPQQ